MECAPPSMAPSTRVSTQNTSTFVHLPEAVRQKMDDHPCYSANAHHHYARLHLAVAPACNIQCHYCNRKYDCSNESRPGVVSELLTPMQAVRKAMIVADKIPELSVVGIAGPGDPLANPERTFKTFQLLAEHVPDLKLCVSTNGLMIEQFVDELVKHNIGHVTITMNSFDPTIGAQIYPWIFWNHRRIKGYKAAEILIEQQQRGLELLTERGILVKINSVLIPGINDQHLPELSRVVKAKGAFLHNIMPLIADASHGTFYGLNHHPAPTPAQLQAVQEACGNSMQLMQHCRQCRSDAVGKLGEDQRLEFSSDTIATMQVDYEAVLKKRATVHAGLREKARQVAVIPLRTLNETNSRESITTATTVTPSVRMAIASTNGAVIDEHFGHARVFHVYQVTENAVQFLETRRADQYCTGETQCGEAEDRLSSIIKVLGDCQVILCAKIGYSPWRQLERAGIWPNSEHALETAESALMAVYRELAVSGRLKPLTATSMQSVRA